jgi:hypothetical protein
MKAPSKDDVRRLRELASTYRTMVILVGVQWVLTWLGNDQRTYGAPNDDPGIGGLFYLGAVGVAMVLAVQGHRLAVLLGRRAPVLWALAMFVPLVNLFALLSLSRAAQDVCKDYGVRVGFLGPDMNNVRMLEQTTSGEDTAPR